MCINPPFPILSLPSHLFLSGHLNLTSPSTIRVMPETPRMSASTPIVRARLTRILRSRRRINRRIRRTARRLATSLPTTGVAFKASTSSSATRLRHILVHALPSRGAASTAIATLLLHAALLLLFVLLLLEGELVLRRVSWSLLLGIGWVLARHTCVGAVEAIASSAAGAAGHVASHHGLHLHWVHATHHVLRVGGTGVAVHTAAHHLHLLHLHRVHATHGAHGSTHAAASLLLGEILLHLLEVLLHALPVLGHHGRRHASVGALRLGVLLVVEACIVAALIVVVELIATEFLVTAIVVTHVASRLCTLDFDGLAENLERLTECGIDSSIAIKGDEAEATWAARLLVHHQRCIHDSAELLKELCKVLLSRLLADTTDEDFARALLLLTGNGALGIDLDDA